MRRPTVLIATLAAGLAGAVGVAGFAAASSTTTATAAAVSFRSFHAHAESGGRVEFEARTSAATKVTFRYRGATFKARVDDDDDRDEWKRTVRRRSGDRVGDRISVRVRACDSSGCRSKTYSTVIRSDDSGDDDSGDDDHGGGSDDD